MGLGLVVYPVILIYPLVLAWVPAQKEFINQPLISTSTLSCIIHLGYTPMINPWLTMKWGTPIAGWLPATKHKKKNATRESEMLRLGFNESLAGLFQNPFDVFIAGGRDSLEAVLARPRRYKKWYQC